VVGGGVAGGGTGRSGANGSKELELRLDEELPNLLSPEMVLAVGMLKGSKEPWR